MKLAYTKTRNGPPAGGGPGPHDVVVGADPHAPEPAPAHAELLREVGDVRVGVEDDAGREPARQPVLQRESPGPGAREIGLLPAVLLGLVERDERVEHDGRRAVSQAAEPRDRDIGVSGKTDEDEVGSLLRRRRAAGAAIVGGTAPSGSRRTTVGSGSAQRLGHDAVARVAGVEVPDVRDGETRERPCGVVGSRRRGSSDERCSAS